ncbi:MAG: response regulator [Archangiaceae bacterium]|nr:response regulator [Archangiaceae bacterium]
MSRPVVLIVEDNQLSRTMLRDALKDVACTVSEAHDGDEAFATLQKSPPAVMLLDLVLPKKSGSEVLKYVKEKRLPTRVLIITAMDTRGMADQALDDGAHGFIGKPFHPLEVRSAVEGALAAAAAGAGR